MVELNVDDSGREAGCEHDQGVTSKLSEPAPGYDRRRQRDRFAVGMTDGVDLYWIPLGAGAGGALVRWCGRTYEAGAAAVARRHRQPLFHSALAVHVADTETVIEMTPVWITRGERGVVAEGTVGLSALGRWRVFRYEVRCWAGGSIPDASEAVGGAHRVSDDVRTAHRVLNAVEEFPALTWGRDEMQVGDMWNSNSLVSWLLIRGGVSLDEVHPPAGGRAPGWEAGIAAAQADPRLGHAAG